MELIINREEFLKGLQLAQGVVDPRRTLPVLQNILLEASKEKQGIYLSVTDLQIGIRGLYRAAVISDATVAVNARKIFELVKELPEDQVKLNLSDNNRFTLTCRRAKFNLPLFPAEDFPSLPQIDLNSLRSFNLEGKLFKEMVRRTIFAASLETTQRILSGVLMKLEGNKIEMAALDGHRLAYIKKNCGVNSNPPSETGVEESPPQPECAKLSAVLSRRTLEELIKIVEGEETGILKFALSENRIFFQYGDVFLFAQLIEGEFPDFYKAIPAENNKTILLDREVFLHALRRVSQVAEEKTRSVTLHFKDNLLIISSQTPEYGEGKEELEIDYSEEEVIINFNARYLLDVLNVLHDRIILNLQNEERGVIIKEADNEDYLNVVMPLRF